MTYLIYGCIHHVHFCCRYRSWKWKLLTWLVRRPCDFIMTNHPG